jgi:N-terminal region of glycosyl transferase group 7/N-terminal domain of galactosyltransferase
MAFAPTPGASDERYSKRLAIVVPYRDRAQHLAQFVPHMVSYFERDKLDRQIDFTINIIEQHGNAPFSRGRLGNCGFLLTRNESDYMCIHDVDYLPMWADYSWSRNPSRLIWHGLSLKEDYYSFFGAVSLLDNAVFSKVNGFPNCYWGWGPEDRELGYRCRIHGLDIERRDGTFIPLRHPSAGFSAPNVWSDESCRTNALYDKRQSRLEALAQEDGVNSLKFDLVEKKLLALPDGITVKNVWHYIVDLGPPDAG